MVDVGNDGMDDPLFKQKKQLGYLLNASQVVEMFAYGFFIASRGIINDTDSANPGSLPGNALDVTALILLFGSATISLILAASYLFFCKAISGKKRVGIPALVSAVLIVANNVGYLFTKQGDILRKSLLPWFAILGISCSKLKDILGMNPYFGGVLVQQGVGNRTNDGTRIPDDNTHKFLTGNQVVEALKVFAIVLSVDFLGQVAGPKEGRIVAGCAALVQAISSLLLFGIYGYAHYMGDTLNTKSVSIYSFLIFALNVVALGFLFSDIEDTSFYPEIAMIALGIGTSVEKLRDVYTVDARFGGSTIIIGDYNDLRGSVIGNVINNFIFCGRWCGNNNSILTNNGEESGYQSMP